MMIPRHLLIFGISLMVLALAPGVLAQDTGHMVRDISRAIERGNARDMAKFFGTNVDLSMPRAEGTFSKSQSEIILRDFFGRNSPATFTVSRQGSMRDGSVYVIGRMTTTEGQAYRCYFLLKNISRNFFLHHIQFELQ